MTDPRPDPPDKRDEPDDDGDATPHWAELPKLDIRDQASMSMAFRFPPLPATPPEDTTGSGSSPDFVVVRDEFAALRQLEKLKETPKPTEATGTPLVYGVVVRNSTSTAMYEVRVEHDLPPGVRYISSDPPGRLTGRRLVWEIGLFEPGSKRRFKIHAQPNRPDSVGPESRAEFPVYQCLHHQSRLLRPHVRLQIRLPSESTLGSKVPLHIEATNTGPGSADDVRLIVAVPPGLCHQAGEVLQFLREKLGPREQFQAQTELHVEQAGTWNVAVHCVGNGRALASASAVVQVSSVPGEVATTPGNGSQSYFLLGVADRLLAVPLRQMIEVHRGGSKSAGITQTIDLRRKLGQPAGGSPARLVLVRDGSGQPVALQVDRTLGIARLSLADGEICHHGQPVTLLDVNALLGESRSLEVTQSRRG